MEAVDDLPLDTQPRPGEVQQVFHRNEIDKGVSNIATFTTDC